MKIRIFCVFFAFTLIAESLFSQLLKHEDLPPGLVYEFKNRFPGVENVKWSIQKEIYFADFLFMGSPVLAQYDKGTRWLQSETILRVEDLPRNLLRYITSQYPNHKLIRMKFMEKRGEDGHYSIETIENNIKHFLFFDKEGVFKRLSDANDKDVATNVIKTEPGMQAVLNRELPTFINSYVMINYANFRIKECYLVNNEEWENVYYIILTNYLEKEIIQLWFDFNGNLLKKIDPFAKDSQNETLAQDNKSKTKVEERKPLSEAMIPKAVRDGFAKKIRNHEELSWDTIKGVYVATFIDPVRNSKNRAEFAKTGTWIQTFTELDPRNLNPNVLNHIQNNFPYLEIKSAEMLSTADRKRFIYVRIFDRKWLNDPMVYHELYFNNAGRLENEVYAIYIDPYDAFMIKEEEQRSEYFMKIVDGEELVGHENYVRINEKELPSKATKHARSTYPEHRIQESYIMKDDFSGQTIYWVILKKEGVRTRIKAIYDFKGNFISEEEF